MLADALQCGTECHQLTDSFHHHSDLRKQPHNCRSLSIIKQQVYVVFDEVGFLSTHFIEISARSYQILREKVNAIMETNAFIPLVCYFILISMPKAREDGF